ncbi:hypothetical protein GCM10025865_01140 [Paraoerskovia sediminicola]|uniref:Phage Mu protein F like protein n=1 Tax=Paraoerskovia sediminicola TaxID=1138587 RepID=A0ABM8FYI7_9CELL|nr:hypothetical protein [Paraoerskovia sediminicola]BDZ40815.1 hypothetical protein GCM10025865_01140 [Paraoerskovia sediminicola]
MASSADLEEFRRANAVLADQVEASLVNFWSYLDLSNPERSRNALLDFVPILVQKYGDVAATIAADWFTELRFDAISEGFVSSLAASSERSFVARAAKPPSVEAVESSVRYSAGALWTDEPEKALESLTYSVRHGVIQTGRETIRQNTFAPGSGAQGWKRVTRPGACRFCRALEARGAVYMKATARFAAHDPKCNCAAAPSFDPNAPEVGVEEYAVSSTKPKPGSEAERVKRERTAAWLERKYPGESDHDFAGN